jgi:hypothetical protein
MLTCYSCSNFSKIIRVESPHKKPTPELEEFRDKILKISKGNLGDKRAMGFVDHIEEYVIGRCILTLENASFEVDIAKNYWHYLSEIEQTFLVAHEFMHCQCGVFHTRGKLKDGCPRSFMNPELPSESCLYKHFKMYAKEMERSCAGK